MLSTNVHKSWGGGRVANKSAISMCSFFIASLAFSKGIVVVNGRVRLYSICQGQKEYRIEN